MSKLTDELREHWVHPPARLLHQAAERIEPLEQVLRAEHESANHLVSPSHGGPCHVIIDYTSWRGIRRERTVHPMRILFGSNQWHPEPQWMLIALDLDDASGEKTFALANIHSWRAYHGNADNV